MRKTKRAALLALPAVLAAGALLCLPGGAYARAMTDQALAVAVDGLGTITATGISCRDGSGDCVELYVDATSVTLTATSDSGATFSGWGGDCSTATGSTCTVSMTSARAVTATFTASGGGGNPTLTVSVFGTGKVTGAGIDCGNGGTDCSESYATDTPVTLTETPGTGATFSGWGGACSGTGTTCTVTMSASQSVTAGFSTSGGTNTLTVTASGNGKVIGPGINCGGGATDCSETYANGTSVTLTETPNTGASFSGWGGSCSGTNSTCTLSINVSKAVSASFGQGSTEKILTVSVSGSGHVTGTGISCGNGAHDCSNAYNDNGAVTLIATATNGAVFVGWGGVCTGTGRVCNLVMDSPKAVSASFSTPGSRQTSTFSVRSLGRPLVVPTSVGWAVTLHFFTSRSAAALVRLSLNGRFVNAFTFNSLAGQVLVGPFNIARAGAYRFWLTLSDGRGGVAEINWNLCIASCSSFQPADVSFRSLGAIAARTSSGWIVKVRFQSSAAATASMRMTVGGRVVNSGTISFHRGQVTVDLPAREAGLHVITLSTRTASGRLIQLRWTVVLS